MTTKTASACRGATSATDEGKLFRLAQAGDSFSRAELTDRYLPLVHWIAQRQVSKLPNSVELSDLEQEGALGLEDAISGFDPDRGIKFKTYASQRILGAMLDFLRRSDWAPRLVRSSATRLQRAQSLVAARHQGSWFGHDFEVAEVLGISLRELKTLVEESDALSMTSLDAEITWTGGDDQPVSRHAFVADSRSSDPAKIAADRDAFLALMGHLNRRERAIFRFFYVKGLTQKQIGQILSLTESRVCQIMGEATKRLQQLHRVPVAKRRVQRGVSRTPSERSARAVRG
ncbi:MAG: sigma-70 family RNA polymerase sigma factor [Bdellovibrionales bacterium]|nr:sigma-70 family RNA polymerase sigma factor [Bdellovibrionales bacterium]